MSAPYPQQPQDTKADLAATAYPPEYPAQAQGGYPAQPQPQGYPAQQQGAYPPQGAYPAQGYQQQQQPPPYYDPQLQAQGGYTQQDQQNVTVVMQPHGVVVGQQVRVDRRPELGIGAIVFAVFSTVFIASLGCWWALPCTIIGIVLGITSSTTGDSGDVSTAKTHCGISVGCTIFGIIFAIAGVVAIVVSVIAVVANANSNPAYG